MKIITHLHSTGKYNILQNKLKKTALSDSLLFYFSVTPRNS